MEVVMEVMVMEVMVMERGMLNLVMDLMEAMEVVMEVMVMEVMVMERGMPNPVTEVVAADLMEDMEDTMDNMDNITFHSSYAPKIVNTSACKFTQLLYVINDKFMN